MTYPAKSIDKIRVAVLRGGTDDSKTTSHKTGEFVLTHAPERFEAFDVFIDMGGVWHYRGIAVPPEQVLSHADIVFNALHGQYGEDGKVQRLVKQFGVPMTGSPSFGSAITSNKHLTKEHLNKAGIKTPQHITVTKESLSEGTIDDLGDLVFPIVIKPARSGSSQGVSLVEEAGQIPGALEEAFKYSDDVMVEEYIDGREATVGVINNFRGEDTYSLMPVEIQVPGGKILDYDSKLHGRDKKIVPSTFSDDQKERLNNIAKKAHKTLGLDDYSRADFIVTNEDVYLIEVNSQPGLSDNCPFPQALESAGISFADFVDHILSQNLKKKDS